MTDSTSTPTNPQDYTYLYHSKEWDIQYSVDLYGSTDTKNTITDSEINVASLDGAVKLTLQKDKISLNRKLLLIVMVDKSRSIQTAWNQIQSTLLNLMASILSSDLEIVTELIFFNDTSFRLVWNKDNYKQLILNEHPNGKTCFASAFSLCGDIIRNYYRKGSSFKSDKDFNANSDTAVVFLTDGSHTTTRDHKKSFKDLRDLIDTITDSTITVHTMGFTPNSRFNDLDGIRKMLGNKPGIYQYAESTDGLYALKDKLQFIFKCIFTTSDTLESTMTIKTLSVKFLDTKSPVRVHSMIFDQQATCDLNLGVYCEDLNYKGPVDIEINIGKGLWSHTCTVLPKLNIGPHFEYFASLTRVDVELNQLLEQIKQHKDQSSKPTDAQKAQYLQSVLHYQKTLSEFDNHTIMKFPSIIRSDIVNLKKSCLDISSKLMEIINSWNRSSWSTESNQKLADISYQFVFKNAGRQRRISYKVAKNIQSINRDSQKLKDLEVDLDVFDDIEDKDEQSRLESSKQLFACILSLSDWVELLEEKDILGFGLSIQRPESVVDDPTQIRIQEVSTTFLGKSSIEDAIALSLEVNTHEKTTGGFQVGANNQSVAVRGRGREPINSWLPLYLHAEHWKAIKYQLKNIIAYFVTLDPLAFAQDQLNSIFLVLGTMISQNDIGERQLFLIFQLIRTLKEIVSHFNYVPRMKQQLKNMLSNSIYLISEQPKNLYVLISYCLVLDNNDLNEIFGTSDKWLQFWEKVIESSIRRACYSIFNQWQQVKVDSFISEIIYGSKDLVITEVVNDEKVEEPVDPNSPEELMKTLLSFKYEKPEIVNYEYEKYLEVKPMDYIKDDPTRKHPEALNRSKLRPLIKLSQIMENDAYPPVRSLINIMKFTNHWRKIYKDETIWQEIDSKFGIPPDHWINSMKEALKPLEGCTTNQGFATYLYTANQLYSDENKRLSNDLMIHQLRSMVVQGITYRINRFATGAVEAGDYTNTYCDPMQCILTIKKNVDLRHFEVIKKMELDLQFSQVTQAGLKSGDMAVFYSAIPSVGDIRFPKFVHEFYHPKRVPFAKQKLIAFLSNVKITFDDFGNIFTNLVKQQSWNIGKKYYLTLEAHWSTQEMRIIWREILYHRYLYESQYNLLDK
ncbi:hypothetical protein DLAC_03694 [Tieghemostelium lacteum]|uniref:VWFA domain-containing protein n=1 Tax=Tieghemostelium lacteum TaxID=361077 RepID=A0A152A0G6_TIELA|nr:hypothetical protein DLAC_03694 [Tieghemostelium lacteum]|eukprot:KYQ99751.1 hypothetical protein DLAC_03694 [Tieghemostelium lacteum]